eukprot:TRINITY_DN115_c0_g2_i11.p1 TRINITY_DN115_c0_g2~~TRINITY_DN115_c0_g2_i11.p1  ORF type:complete len:276 (-),score=81.42 TRINITY_DN115_c0_g2_i11:133-894(-)
MAHLLAETAVEEVSPLDMAHLLAETAAAVEEVSPLDMAHLLVETAVEEVSPLDMAHLLADTAVEEVSPLDMAHLLADTAAVVEHGGGGGGHGGGGGGGVSSGYGAPTGGSSYSAPATGGSSYGAPAAGPSSSYGAPRNSRYHKRSTQSVFVPDEEAIFNLVASLDVHSCGKLLVCELEAKDSNSLQEDELLLLTLFGTYKASQKVDPQSSKAEYDLAAELGQLTKDQVKCRRRYRSCPYTAEELMLAFRQSNL